MTKFLMLIPISFLIGLLICFIGAIGDVITGIPWFMKSLYVVGLAFMFAGIGALLCLVISGLLIAMFEK